MSKAQARQGSGGRSGAARAGSGSKNGRAAGSPAGGARAGSGKPASGGAQRSQAGGAKAAARSNGATTRAGGAKAGTPANGASATAKAPAGQAATGATAAPVQGKRWLLGMNGIEASTLILSIIGLGVAIYATILHYDSSIHVVCLASGAIDCQAVMTSSQSVVFGIFPVAVLGMAFFLFMIAINGPWAWRAKFPAALGGRALNSRTELIRRARLGSVIVGMGFVIYLIYAELVQIQKICLWCTSVHIITFLLFVIIVFNASFSWGRTEVSRGT
jgi:uncharacterized membrane protein